MPSHSDSDLPVRPALDTDDVVLRAAARALADALGWGEEGAGSDPALRRGVDSVLAVVGVEPRLALAHALSEDEVGLLVNALNALRVERTRVLAQWLEGRGSASVADVLAVEARVALHLDELSAKLARWSRLVREVELRAQTGPERREAQAET